MGDLLRFEKLDWRFLVQTSGERKTFDRINGMDRMDLVDGMDGMELEGGSGNDAVPQVRKERKVFLRGL